MGFFSSRKDSDTDRSPGERLALPEIVASKVRSLVTLDGPHYVFMLTFINDERIVLKAESQVNTNNSVISHNFGVRIMGHISPVKAQTVSPREEMEISRLQDGVTLDFFRAEQRVSSGDYGWVKAAYQTGLTGLKGQKDIDKKDEGGWNVTDPEKFKKGLAETEQLLKDLKGNQKAWRSLGEVVAADMFNGNSDRINLHREDIVNLGNVQFRRKGKKIVEAVGLDTFDPSQAGTGANLNSADITQWKIEFGEYLKNLPEAKKKIAGCIDNGKYEINRVFKTTACQWGDKEKKWLYEGYVSGVEKLKKKLGADVKRLAGPVSMLPKGLVARVKDLGWA